MATRRKDAATPDSFASFLAMRAAQRTGEARERLDASRLHSSEAFFTRVWLPAIGNVEGLEPEYPLVDYDDRQRFLDFAYFHGTVRIAIEIDDYTSHAAQVGRYRFSDHLRRQNHLQIEGWFVLRFSYDDVTRESGRCQRALQQFMWRRIQEGDLLQLEPRKREIVRLARAARSSITPSEAAAVAHCRPALARKLLKGLVQEGWLVPARGEQRIRAYSLAPNRRGTPS